MSVEGRGRVVGQRIASGAKCDGAGEGVILGRYRAEGSRFAAILAELVPTYASLIESFTKAQAVVNDGPETQLDKYQ